jgi:FAD binding domain-containing protein
MVEGVLTELRQAVGSAHVAAGDEIEPRYLQDCQVPMAHGRPLALARAGSTHEVSAVLRVCHAHRLPVVTQGGLTGLAGGATPVDGCVVLSLERLAGVEEIDAAAADRKYQLHFEVRCCVVCLPRKSWVIGSVHSRPFMARNSRPWRCSSSCLEPVSPC